MTSKKVSLPSGPADGGQVHYSSKTIAISIFDSCKCLHWCSGTSRDNIFSAESHGVRPRNVTKLYVKDGVTDGVTKMVCDKEVCEDAGAETEAEAKAGGGGRRRSKKQEPHTILINFVGNEEDIPRRCLQTPISRGCFTMAH